MIAYLVVLSRNFLLCPTFSSSSVHVESQKSLELNVGKCSLDCVLSEIIQITAVQ